MPAKRKGPSELPQEPARLIDRRLRKPSLKSCEVQQAAADATKEGKDEHLNYRDAGKLARSENENPLETRQSEAKREHIPRADDAESQEQDQLDTDTDKEEYAEVEYYACDIAECALCHGVVTEGSETRCKFTDSEIRSECLVMVHTKRLKKCDRQKEYVCPFHYEFLNDGVNVTFPVSVVFTAAARVSKQKQ